MIKPRIFPTAKIKFLKHHSGNITAVAILTMLFLQTSPALAQQENPTLAWGKDLFMRHCISCHGNTGKGDGPAATALKTPPSDLTQISIRAGGDFPRTQVKRYIDGGRPIAAHGSRQMPVWGKLFRSDTSDNEARMQIFALTAFLESIQAD